MKFLMTLAMVLSAVVFTTPNAEAFNCDRITKRQERVCGKRPNSRRCKKLTAKKKACDDNNGDKSAAKSAWKSGGKSAFKEDWKANKKDYKSKRKCDRIRRRLQRALDKGKEKRIERLKGRAEKKGCDVSDLLQ